MADQPTPSSDSSDQSGPPMNRAARRAQQRGKQPPITPEFRFGSGRGRPVPLPPRRSGRRGNR